MDNNDDEWLYGSGGDNQEKVQDEDATNEEPDIEQSAANLPIAEKTFETFDEQNFEEAGDHEQLAAEDSKDGNEESQERDEEEDSDDDDDDDINVVIGDIKSGGTSNYVKGVAPGDQKQKQPGSKFNIEEFESVGTINGQPAFEFAIESIEDKPWRKPGADITDYFNYGFNEETWRSYCERQKRMRLHESGIGLASLTAAQNPTNSMNPNDNIIKPNIGGFKRMGGPRMPKPPYVGTIDVIGAPSQNPIRPTAPRENVIQVMTADRREYSRTVVNQPPMFMNQQQEEFYHEPEPDFYSGYEPTQDSHAWDTNQGWTPSEIKELTPMNQPPPMNNPMQQRDMSMNINIPPPMMGNMHRMPHMMPPQNQQNMMGQPIMGQMQIKQEMDDKRDRRMGNRDFRDDSRRHDDRKRIRERSLSRERDSRKSDRSREDRSRSDRDSRYARESSSRRRSKSRDRTERTRRSKSRDKMRSKSRDRKGDDKERSTRSDKSKRSKKEDS